MPDDTMLEFDRPRHFLIVKRHETGTMVGFLCHENDVADWQKSIDWGEIVSSHPLAFHDEGAPPSDDGACERRLSAALDAVGVRVGHDDDCADLLLAIEQIIGMAYDAGRQGERRRIVEMISNLPILPASARP